MVALLFKHASTSKQDLFFQRSMKVLYSMVGTIGDLETLDLKQVGSRNQELGHSYL